MPTGLRSHPKEKEGLNQNTVVFAVLSSGPAALEKLCAIPARMLSEEFRETAGRQEEKADPAGPGDE